MSTIWDNLNDVTINASDDRYRNAFLESFEDGISKVLDKITAPTPTTPPVPAKPMPTFAFPSLDRRVSGLPVLGEFGAADYLLAVCWGVGLSPRPISETIEDNSQCSLRFVIDPLSAWATSRVGFDKLKIASKPDIDLDAILPGPTSGSLHRDAVVEDLLIKLNAVSGISVQCHPHTLRQWVSFSLPRWVSLTQLADAVAASLGAHWTWTDNWVFLGPPGYSGGSRSEQMECCGSSDRS